MIAGRLIGSRTEVDAGDPLCKWKLGALSPSTTSGFALSECAPHP